MKTIKLFLNSLIAMAIISGATSCMQEYEPSDDVVALRQAQAAKLEAEALRDSVEAELRKIDIELAQLNLERALREEAEDAALADIQFAIDSLEAEIDYLNGEANFLAGLEGLESDEQERAEDLRDEINDLTMEVVALDYDALIVSTYRNFFDAEQFRGSIESSWYSKGFRSDVMDYSNLYNEVVGLNTLLGGVPYSRRADYNTVVTDLMPLYEDLQTKVEAAIEEEDTYYSLINPTASDLARLDDAEKAVKVALNAIATIDIAQYDEASLYGYYSINTFEEDSKLEMIDQDDLDDDDLTARLAWYYAGNDNYYSYNGILSQVESVIVDKMREKMEFDAEMLAVPSIEASMDEIASRISNEKSDLQALIADHQAELDALLN